MTCHRIMIIEDEPDLLETLKDLLEISGFQVLTARNGQEGLRLLKDIGKPCLILLDLMMPVMNGWEFLETLRKDLQYVLASVPVAVISAAADMTDVQHQYGCRVLRKPVNIDTLVSLAQEHC